MTVVPSPKNTLVFSHLALSTVSGEPHVLAVKDGGYFQVRFVCTDPTKFNYTIKADTDAQQKLATQGVADHVETTDISGHASVTMRHSKLFARYRVEVSLRDELRPKPSGTGAAEAGGGPGVVGPPKRTPGGFVLYSTFFDLWVDTQPDWTVDFSGGVAFTGLRGHEYFIKTDTKGTADANDDVKTVEEDVAARASFRPDVIALANVRHPRALGFGAAFGVGLNNDADPRYFLGASYLLGARFIFHAGWAGGKVNELPAGQELHKSPVNADNTLTTPSGRFRSAFYFGIAFTFIDRESEFKGAFAATQHTTKEEADVSPAPAAKQYGGKYSTAGEPDATIAQQDDKLTLKLGAGSVEPLTADDDLHYHVTSDLTRVVTFILNEAKQVASLEYKTPAKTTTYKKSDAQ